MTGGPPTAADRAEGMTALRFNLACRSGYQLMLVVESVPEPHERIELQRRTDPSQIWDWPVVKVLHDTRGPEGSAFFAQYGIHRNGCGWRHDDTLCAQRLVEEITKHGGCPCPSTSCG